MPLLGRISAVLSANTQDFTRGIRQAGRELDAFRRSSQGFQLNLGRDSLDRTLTSLQRFQRQIQEIRNQIATDGALRLSLPNPNVLAAQFKVFQDVGRPLTDLKTKIEGLSNTLQAGLYPELEKIQGRFQSLFRTISEGPQRLMELQRTQAALTRQLASFYQGDRAAARSPEASRLRSQLAEVTREADGLRKALDLTNQQRSIDSMVIAIQRLGRVTSAMKDLGALTGALDASGVGASFYQPRLKDSLRKTQSLRSAAEAIPARFRTSAFADLTQRGEENAVEIERELARLSKLEGLIARNATRTRGGPQQMQRGLALERDREATQIRINALARRQEAINRSFSAEQVTASVRETQYGLGSYRRTRGDIAAEAGSEFRDLAKSLREISSARFQPLIASAGEIVEQFNRGTASVESLNKALASLRGAAASSKDAAKAGAAFSAVFTDRREATQAEIRRRAQLQRDVLTPGSNAARLLDVREQAELAREVFNRNSIPRFEGFEKAGEKISDSTYARELEKVRTQSIQVDSALREAFDSDNVVTAEAALRRYREQLVLLQEQYAKMEPRAKRFSEAAAQISLFRRESGSSSEKLDPRLQRAAVSLMVMRQAVGQYSEKPGAEDARFRAGESISRSESRIEALTAVRARVAQSERFTPDERASRMAWIDKRIESQVESAKKTVAKESGGRLSEKKLQSQIDRAVKSTGSFSVAGAASGQLAIQQGLFAIDDLMSATGGLEYKLRAVGNNISQFGLLLGQSGMIPGLTATTGLFLGMAAVLTGHVAVAIAKTVFRLDEAEARFRSMNELLEKSKSTAEATAKSYETLAKSIRESVSAGAATSRSGTEKRIKEAREERKKAYEDYISARNPEILDARARAAAAKKRLEETRNPGERVRLLRDLEFEERREKQIRRREVRIGPTRAPSGADAAEELRQLEARSAEIRKQQKNTDLLTYSLAFVPDFEEGTLLGTSGDIGNRGSTYAQQYRARNKELVQIEGRIAELKGMAESQKVDAVLRSYESGYGAASAAESAFQSLGKSAVDADIQAMFGTRLQKAADVLSEQLDLAFKAATEDRKDDMDVAMKAANEAADSLSKLAAEADAVAGEFRLGGRRSVESVLQGSAELAGERPSAVGTLAARKRVEFDQAVEARNRAEERGNQAGVDAAQSQIDKVRAFSRSLEQCAIAMASLNRATENAATALSSALVGEAQSSAEQARRRKNRLAGDAFEGGAAADDFEAARARKRSMERANRELAAAIDAERDALAADMRAGRAPEAARLAAIIQSQNEIANDKTTRYTDEERRQAKAAAEQSQARLDEILEQRPAAQEARKKVDALDAAEQRRLEGIRKDREETSRRLAPTGEHIDSSRRTFSAVGDVERLILAERLARRDEEVKRRISETPAGSPIAAGLQKEMDDIRRDSIALRQRAISTAVQEAATQGNNFASQSRAARRRLDAAGPSGVDFELTRLEVRRRELESMRDKAVEARNDDEARKSQEEIDSIDNLVRGINSTAIALEGFMSAANKAALALQGTVTKEAEGAASGARRRANEAEALFGAQSPQAKEARARQERLERMAREAQDEDAAAREEIARERVRFEQEMTPAQKERAERIRELEAAASNQELTPAEREAAAAESEALRRQQEREFEDRPGAQRAARRANQSDARQQEAAAADRGRELVKSDIERRKEDAERKAAEVSAYVNQVRAERGRDAARKEAQKGALELARSAAPLYAQFGEELANARLQGPSRAALRVQDIGTTEGASELNRLLRGDDDARNVNLQEMRQQTLILREIEDTIRRQTGIPVIIG